MDTATRAAGEGKRLASLREYHVLDTPPERVFDELTELAAALCAAPIALISLVDETRVWCKSRVGFEIGQCDRTVSFCTYVLDQTSPLVVPDALRDGRFASSRLVAEEPGIRFYAGAPLVTPRGQVLGALCVMDRRPRELSPAQIRGLSALSRQVMMHFELRRQARQLGTREASLRESQERLQLALDAARMGTFDWDIARNRITWSRGHEELWGMPPGSFRGTYEAFAERVHPDDLPGVNDEVARCIREHEAYEQEIRVMQLDGSVRWVLGRGQFDFDGTGKAVRMRGVVQDVTARKSAEEGAREHEERFAARIHKLNRVYAMLGSINEAIVRRETLEDMLAAACRITVRTGGFRMAWIGLRGDDGMVSIAAHAGADDETLGVIRTLIRVTPPAGCVFTAEALRSARHAICNDIAADPRTSAWRAEALLRDYRSMAALPLVSDGRAVGTFCIYSDEPGVFDEQEVQLLDDVATDISFALNLHRQNAERRQAEERFRLVVENIQEVFWIADARTQQPLYVSPAYETIWGRSRESLYASPDDWVEAVHPDDRARLVDVVGMNHLTGRYDETFRIRRPDGSIRWIRARVFPARNAEGQLERTVGTATDITEQRQLEEQFRQAQKMESVGRLAGGIAHDFNNLLTVINGVAELAIIDLPPDSPLRADLIQIRQAGDRAAALTRQLLTLSRQQIIKPAVINLTTVLNGMRSMLRRLIGEHITLAFALGTPLGYVKADPGQIEQVVLNLAVNAQDAMPDGGTLTIETANVNPTGHETAGHLTARTGPCVLIAVSDTGIGMDEGTRQRIFEPFFTTKALGKGTGLGLSTVYGIVEQSGGGLYVYSEPGRGTTFKIYLPRVDEVPAQLPSDTIAERGGTETILLVEDEAALRALTRRVLEASGYTVLEAGNGTDALALLSTYRAPLELLLTDVVMPGMSGRDLAARVAELRPGVRVLFASGYTDDNVFRHGVLEDGSHFISKPYVPADLRRRVREILDQA